MVINLSQPNGLSDVDTCLSGFSLTFGKQLLMVLHTGPVIIRVSREPFRTAPHFYGEGEGLEARDVQ